MYRQWCLELGSWKREQKLVGVYYSTCVCDCQYDGSPVWGCGHFVRKGVINSNIYKLLRSTGEIHYTGIGQQQQQHIHNNTSYIHIKRSHTI